MWQQRGQGTGSERHADTWVQRKATGAPGRSTLVERVYGDAVQRRAVSGSGGAESADVHADAERGVSGAGAALPHLDRIQRLFGRHDLSGVQAHTGGEAASACDAIGASAYATGNHVAFAGPPSLHTAAHEAAHVVQQRAGVHLAGGVGEAGDEYEQHADQVADAVVAGRSAEALLERHAGSVASVAMKRAPTGAVTGHVQRKCAACGTAMHGSGDCASCSGKPKSPRQHQRRALPPGAAGALVQRTPSARDGTAHAAATPVQRQEAPGGGGQDGPPATPPLPDPFHVDPGGPFDVGDNICTLQVGGDGWEACCPIPGAAPGSDNACFSDASIDRVRQWLERHRPPTLPHVQCPDGRLPNQMLGYCCPPGQAPEGIQCVTPQLPPLPSLPTPGPGPTQPAPPAPPPGNPGLATNFTVGVLDDFNIDESSINSRQQANWTNIVQQVHQWMTSCPRSFMIVTGFADSPGEDQHNMELGQRRADSIKMSLQIALLDIQSAQPVFIISRSEGENQPVDPAAGTGYSARNRRVEIQLFTVCPPTSLSPPGSPAAPV